MVGIDLSFIHPVLKVVQLRSREFSFDGTTSQQFRIELSRAGSGSYALP